MIKQEGLYQNKVTVSLASIFNCNMAYYTNCCFSRFSGVAFAAWLKRFYILFEQIINIIESFALSPG